MKTRRGDVVLVLFPNSDLRTARRRPALVLQRDNLGSGLEQTIVAMIEQQPVPGIMRDRSTPAATSSSSSIARSSIDSEFASLLVPKTASPQFCDSNHLQCATNRWLSGARSALNGADGISDIEGKVTRVGASEREANEFQRGNNRRQHAANTFVMVSWEPLTQRSCRCAGNSSRISAPSRAPSITIAFPLFLTSSRACSTIRSIMSSS